MLVLTRKVNQKIRIGDHITIMVVDIRGGSTRLGIDAPEDMNVVRTEIDDNRKEEEKHE